jgi:hypothetical protein
MLPVLSLLCGSFGCSAGTDLNQIVHVDPFPDAGAVAITDGAGSAFQDPFAGAPPLSAQTGSLTHNAGKSCLQSGCHGPTTGANLAPGLLLGGTVYSDYLGTKPAVGVELRIVDSAGSSATARSGPDGNFYILSTGANGVTFPAAVGVRDMTTTRPMITTLTTQMGSCAQTTCHVPGGGPMTNTGNYYPIHVP